MDKLLARLSEQQAVLNQQNETLKSSEERDFPGGNAENNSSSNSLPVTPATDGFTSTAATTRPASAALDTSVNQDTDEILRLKLELAQAQNHISKLDQELAVNRNIKTEMEPLGNIMARGSAPALHASPWPPPEDSHSDISDSMSADAFGRPRGAWSNSRGPLPNPALQMQTAEPAPGHWLGGRGFNQVGMDTASIYAVPGDRGPTDSDAFVRHPGRRNNRLDNRAAPQYGGGYGGYQGYNGLQNQPDGMYTGPKPNINLPSPSPQNMPPMAMNMYPQYQQPMATALSPHASEFTSKATWKNEVRTKTHELAIRTF